ncbi:Hypothetical predicted protein [Marmota monax]|uniref:Uncharacterized protein n=1 Tax=Marmota monax TaxID=9995 RepID=A0A5E4B131_MARMO|nr:hypothetical protein GHT09_005857 [Marmota monax]VTJ63407.1 Hypothetical predicted protein [Marmota monax]
MGSHREKISQYSPLLHSSSHGAEGSGCLPLERREVEVLVTLLRTVGDQQTQPYLPGGSSAGWRSSQTPGPAPTTQACLTRLSQRGSLQRKCKYVLGSFRAEQSHFGVQLRESLCQSIY